MQVFSFLAVSHIQEERTNFRVDAILAESVATGRVWDSFVLLPRILGCWGSFTRAFLPGRLVYISSLRSRHCPEHGPEAKKKKIYIFQKIAKRFPLVSKRRLSLLPRHGLSG